VPDLTDYSKEPPVAEYGAATRRRIIQPSAARRLPGAFALFSFITAPGIITGISPDMPVAARDVDQRPPR
jgi:hypothetical protein